ncbi:MAG: TPM domain-containing protein [Flavobacteriales bacterium]|nr:TPM domain-containing protein [Flavobacteriales bacterium]
MRLVLLVIWLLGSAVATNAARFNCSLAKPDDQERLAFSYAKLLSDSELARINDRLVAFARETSNQFLLVIVDTLCGMEASDLAFEIGERWGIGQQGFDNGLVFLVKPIGGAGDRKVFIATGYGLEGAIPDATCKRIVEEEVIPRFKRGASRKGLKPLWMSSFPWPKVNSITAITVGNGCLGGYCFSFWCSSRSWCCHGARG